MLTLVLADVSRNRMPFSRAIASPEIRFVYEINIILWVLFNGKGNSIRIKANNFTGVSKDLSNKYLVNTLIKQTPFPFSFKQKKIIIQK